MSAVMFYTCMSRSRACMRCTKVYVGDQFKVPCTPVCCLVMLLLALMNLQNHFLSTCRFGFHAPVVRKEETSSQLAATLAGLFSRSAGHRVEQVAG